MVDPNSIKVKEEEEKNIGYGHPVMYWQLITLLNVSVMSSYINSFSIYGVGFGVDMPAMSTYEADENFRMESR